MKKYLFILLCLVFLNKTFAQQLPDLNAYSTDIGFNTNILLNGILSSSSSPFDIMLKKQKNNSAIRWGASLYVVKNFNPNVNNSNYDLREDYSFSISVGKEIQKQLSKHWIFYYGGTIAPNYSSTIQHILTMIF
jgi:hypothetical protein